MWYKEYLRARKTVVIYTIIWAAVFVGSSLLTWWLPMSGIDIDAQHAAASGQVTSTLVPLPWPSLVAVAALIASIVATVLGSTLSQENDGHLELALTKPYSRVAYATTSIAVDFAAILVAVLVALVFIMLHILIFHRTTNVLVSGADPFVNAVRFTLFPLAWYAVIAGISAGLRGKAGIVQGLIWPVAIGTAGLREIPGSGNWQIWHAAFVALNVINPLVYEAYQDHGTSADISIVAGNGLGVAVAAAALLLFVIAGWAAAAFQWKRVEAS
jgi:hypothetical protein